MSLSKNKELSYPSFPDLIWESSIFNRFWIVRSSRTMTKHEFLDRLEYPYSAKQGLGIRKVIDFISNFLQEEGIQKVL